MRLRTVLWLTAIGLTMYAVAGREILRAQKSFEEYAGREYVDFPLPPDWNVPAEFTRARLRYPDVSVRYLGDSYMSWTIDYPRSDRHLLEGLRRLTRIDARSVEQVVDLDGSDDPYNWPFLYGVEVGHWRLTDAMALQMREYLQRGGFFMTDDFHGTQEWNNFLLSMNKVFPDRQIVDLDNKDPIFHVIYDLDDRYQIPGIQFLYSGKTYEYDGFEAKWRGIYDDKGRIMVAICHNMDLGDAIEHSDNPRYPEKWASLAFRISTNYAMYDLTH